MQCTEVTNDKGISTPENFEGNLYNFLCEHVHGQRLVTKQPSFYILYPAIAYAYLWLLYSWKRNHFMPNSRLNSFLLKSSLARSFYAMLLFWFFFFCAQLEVAERMYK
jgi:hypothetical protein